MVTFNINLLYTVQDKHHVSLFVLKKNKIKTVLGCSI